MQLSHRDTRALSVARRASRLSNGKFKLGAVVTSGSKIVGVGYNWNQNPPTIHWESGQCAEHRALRDASSCAKGSTVYVTRVSSTGEFRNARPCQSCVNDMKKAGVSKVIYTIGPDEYGMLRI